MIKSVFAREIIASNGYPTVETIVTLQSGATGQASVPYGTSAGSYEAKLLLDEDDFRFGGKGALKAVKNVNEIIGPSIVGRDSQDQRSLDQLLCDLDGTPDKSNLGGNAILSVSLAVAKAAAAASNQPLYKHLQQIYGLPAVNTLPLPMAVAIEGGKHADETTDIQEYSFVALKENSPRKAIQKVLESYHQLSKVLKNQNLSINVGFEGAFAPSGIASNEAPFEYMVKAITNAKFQPGHDIGISVDAAANEFFADGSYNLRLEHKSLSSAELIEFYSHWLEKYPIVSFEDMLHEDDWSNWTKLTEVTNKHNVINVGDDLTVTSIKRLNEAIASKAITGILIKLNQIGSLTETVDCCVLANEHGIATIPSHRGGGETTDTSMIDLAVAVGSKYVKVGPTRGERVVKYNRLMEIEDELI